MHQALSQDNDDISGLAAEPEVTRVEQVQPTQSSPAAAVAPVSMSPSSVASNTTPTARPPLAPIDGNRAAFNSQLGDDNETSVPPSNTNSKHISSNSATPNQTKGSQSRKRSREDGNGGEKDDSNVTSGPSGSDLQERPTKRPRQSLLARHRQALPPLAQITPACQRQHNETADSDPTPQNQGPHFRWNI